MFTKWSRPLQKDPKKVFAQERDVANWEKLAAELTHKVSNLDNCIELQVDHNAEPKHNVCIALQVDKDLVYLVYMHVIILWRTGQLLIVY